MLVRLFAIATLSSASKPELVSVAPPTSTREELKLSPILPPPASIVPVSRPIDAPGSCSNNPQRLVELMSDKEQKDKDIIALIKGMNEEEVRQSIDGFTPLYAAIEHDRSHVVIDEFTTKSKESLNDSVLLTLAKENVGKNIDKQNPLHKNSLYIIAVLVGKMPIATISEFLVQETIASIKENKPFSSGLEHIGLYYVHRLKNHSSEKEDIQRDFVPSKLTHIMQDLVKKSTPTLSITETPLLLVKELLTELKTTLPDSHNSDERTKKRNIAEFFRQIPLKEVSDQLKPLITEGKILSSTLEGEDSELALALIKDSRIKINHELLLEVALKNDLNNEDTKAVDLISVLIEKSDPRVSCDIFDKMPIENLEKKFTSLLKSRKNLSSCKFYMAHLFRKIPFDGSRDLLAESKLAEGKIVFSILEGEDSALALELIKDTKKRLNYGALLSTAIEGDKKGKVAPDLIKALIERSQPFVAQFVLDKVSADLIKSFRPLPPGFLIAAKKVSEDTKNHLTGPTIVAIKLLELHQASALSKEEQSSKLEHALSQSKENQMYPEGSLSFMEISDTDFHSELINTLFESDILDKALPWLISHASQKSLQSNSEPIIGWEKERRDLLSAAHFLTNDKNRRSDMIEIIRGLVLKNMHLDSRSWNKLEELKKLFPYKKDTEVWRILDKQNNYKFLMIIIPFFILYALAIYRVVRFFDQQRPNDHSIGSIPRLEEVDTNEKARLFEVIFEKLGDIPDRLKNDQGVGRNLQWLRHMADCFELKHITTYKELKEEISELLQKVDNLNNEIENLFAGLPRNTINDQVCELLLREIFASHANDHFGEQFITVEDVIKLLNLRNERLQDQQQVSPQILRQAARDYLTNERVTPAFSLKKLIEYLNSQEDEQKTD